MFWKFVPRDAPTWDFRKIVGRRWVSKWRAKTQLHTTTCWGTWTMLLSAPWLESSSHGPRAQDEVSLASSWQSPRKIRASVLGLCGPRVRPRDSLRVSRCRRCGHGCRRVKSGPRRVTWTWYVLTWYEDDPWYKYTSFFPGRPRDDRPHDELSRRTRERRVALLLRSSTNELGDGLERRLINRGDRPTAQLVRRSIRGENWVSLCFYVTSFQGELIEFKSRFQRVVFRSSCRPFCERFDWWRSTKWVFKRTRVFGKCR